MSDREHDKVVKLPTARCTDGPPPAGGQRVPVPVAWLTDEQVRWLRDLYQTEAQVHFDHADQLECYRADEAGG